MHTVFDVCTDPACDMRMRGQRIEKQCRNWTCFTILGSSKTQSEANDPPHRQHVGAAELAESSSSLRDYAQCIRMSQSQDSFAIAESNVEVAVKMTMCTGMQLIS
jgi:hypothetical protein